MSGKPNNGAAEVGNKTDASAPSKYERRAVKRLLAPAPLHLEQAHALNHLRWSDHTWHLAWRLQVLRFWLVRLTLLWSDHTLHFARGLQVLRSATTNPHIRRRLQAWRRHSSMTHRGRRDHEKAITQLHAKPSDTVHLDMCTLPGERLPSCTLSLWIELPDVSKLPLLQVCCFQRLFPQATFVHTWRCNIFSSRQPAHRRRVMKQGFVCPKRHTRACA